MVVEGDKETIAVDTLIQLPADAAIPRAIQVLTRITPEDLVGRPSFAEILPTLPALCTPTTIVVGQNVPFDIGMLRGEGWDLSAMPWIDTSMLASLVFPELSSYSLGFVSDALGLNHTPRHRALGDVRATIQLLQRCRERLEELPPADMATLQALSARGPEGYRRFFASLKGKGTQRPLWLASMSTPRAHATPLVIDPPAQGTVHVMEEPLAPAFFDSVLNSLHPQTWLAVKNLRSTLRRTDVPETVVVLDAPGSLLSESAAAALMAQPILTADEMTLAMKIALYAPRTERDLPLHGGERSVWSGKLACTAASPEYRALRTNAAHAPAILSHQQVLVMAQDPEAPLPRDIALIIDDASMLEDTATNACAWTFHFPTLRGAAEGNARLTQCVDIVDLWSERVRRDADMVYLTASHIDDPTTRDLAQTIDAMIVTDDLPPLFQGALTDLRRILDPKNLPGRLAWIEAYGDRQKTIKSVPEHVAPILTQALFAETKTTLLLPPGDDAWWTTLTETPLTHSTAKRTEPGIALRTAHGIPLASLVEEPGYKTIILVGSKRMIEDLYVRHAETMEANGGTLICQGFHGGQGRMEAEFAAAAAPATLVMTPWMYEGMDLPPGTAHRLVLHTLPFDHPSHPVVSRRSARYRDGFREYAMPRLLQRLFRLIRTFARHARANGEILVLDERIATKAYGRDITAYLARLFGEA